MKYATVCSGIEAPAVAWDPLGWRQVFSSEIEAFPSAVMAHHKPDVPNLGDMTNYKEWPDYAIDLICGGTPCQSFSIAGLRKGLDDPRGNLALTFIGLVDRYRPKWVLWENVPGVFSSDEGQDLESFIRGMAEIGYFGAWRVLDAQWFGVAQRRKRVFALFCIGDWRRAAAVLLEPESLRGDPAPSRETGQDTAAGTGKRAENGAACHWDGEGHPHPTLNQSRNIGGIGSSNQEVFSQRGGGPVPANGIPDVVGALSDGAHHGGGLNGQDAYSGRIIPTVASMAFSSKQDGGVAETFCLQGGGHTSQSSQTPGWKKEEAFTLNCMDVHGVAVFSMMPMNSGKDFKARKTDVSQPHRAAGPSIGNQGGDVVAHSLTTRYESSEDGTGRGTPEIFETRFARNGRGAPGDLCPSLNAQAGQSGKGDDAPCTFSAESAVRRLTPVECERLQGFPDNYTKIPWKGKAPGQCPDGPRYKALGNSMAVPVIRWIGERIQLMEEVMAEQAAKSTENADKEVKTE